MYLPGQRGVDAHEHAVRLDVLHAVGHRGARRHLQQLGRGGAVVVDVDAAAEGGVNPVFLARVPHFLGPADQGDVGHAGFEEGDRLARGESRAGARVVGVDDRDPVEPDRAERALAPDAVLAFHGVLPRVGEHGQLDRGQVAAGVRDGTAHGGGGQARDRMLDVAAELGIAGTD